MDRPVYLVAGSSSGMGRQTALKLGESDGHVVLAARNVAACEEAAEQIRAASGSAEAIQFDGTDKDSVNALIEQIDRDHGRLDGAFNNIGNTQGSATVHETPYEQWDASLAVNVSSVFYLMKAEIPLMLRAGWGRIVNNSSTAGLKGIAMMSDYSASKWAVIGLTKSATLDYAAKGIVINVIAPGIIETERFGTMQERMPEVFESLQKGTPAQRFGDMSEIAETVDWLLRSAPDYINGTVIPVDGGRTA